MSIGSWIDKEVVVLIHDGILLSYKMEYIWVSSNEVDEPWPYYTEWSQKEKNITYLCIYTESRKMVLRIVYTGQQRRHRHKKQTLDSGEEEEGGMIWENSIET